MSSSCQVICHLVHVFKSCKYIKQKIHCILTREGVYEGAIVYWVYCLKRTQQLSYIYSFGLGNAILLDSILARAIFLAIKLSSQLHPEKNSHKCSIIKVLIGHYVGNIHLSCPFQCINYHPVPEQSLLDTLLYFSWAVQSTSTHHSGWRHLLMIHI